jgi:hypothetical protein
VVSDVVAGPEFTWTTEEYYEKRFEGGRRLGIFQPGAFRIQIRSVAT